MTNKTTELLNKFHFEKTDSNTYQSPCMYYIVFTDEKNEIGDLVDFWDGSTFENLNVEQMLELYETRTRNIGFDPIKLEPLEGVSLASDDDLFVVDSE